MANDTKSTAAAASTANAPAPAKTRSGTIQIFTPAKTFRFKNPDVSDETLLGQPDKTVVSSAYFTTEPGKLQLAPAWIQDDPMFVWAVREDAIVVTSASAAAPVAALLKGNNLPAPAPGNNEPKTGLSGITANGLEQTEAEQQLARENAALQQDKTDAAAADAAKANNTQQTNTNGTQQPQQQKGK